MRFGRETTRQRRGATNAMSNGFYALGLGIVFCQIMSAWQSIRLLDMSEDDYRGALDLVDIGIKLKPQLVSLVVVLFILKDTFTVLWVSWALVLMPYSWLWYIGVITLSWHLYSLGRNIKMVSLLRDFSKPHIDAPTLADTALEL